MQKSIVGFQNPSPSFYSKLPAEFTASLWELWVTLLLKVIEFYFSTVYSIEEPATPGCKNDLSQLNLETQKTLSISELQETILVYFFVFYFFKSAVI